MDNRTNKFYQLNIILFAFLLTGCAGTGRFEVESPDGNIRFIFSAETGREDNEALSFSIEAWNKTVLLPSYIELFTDTNVTDFDYKVKKVENKSIDTTWINSFGEKREIPEIYNELKVFMERNSEKFNFIIRVYNEGAAFAYEFPEQEGIDSLIIFDENIVYNFPEDHFAWSAARAQAPYSRVPVSKIEKGCERPLVIEYDSSLTIALAEAKLVNYARMKFEPDSTESISIRSRLDSEVHKSLPFQSPWRVVMIGKNPGDLLEKNYFLLNLNDPSEIEDISWIKPGKVLREVTLTTVGAMAAIDFTSSHNMQYVEFDAGWYGLEYDEKSDASEVNLDPARSKGPLDMEKVIEYARSKDIRILLYVNRRALEKQLDEILPIYKSWGIAGLKYGFVQVGTQDATSWLHEAIKKAASYHLIIDVHDEYRPTGWSRTYPNFLTQEGIRGDEESPTNSHTLITMFTRMLAGPGDNTICYYNERVDNKMGSHASQLAKAVCLFSPLQFMYWYDKAAPSLKKDDGQWGNTNYIGDEPELEFFNNVPTLWDETRVLYASISEYGVIARRKGTDWFIGGINGDKSRTIDLKFNMLTPGVKYSARIYSDDPEVNSRTHVRIDAIDVDAKTVYNAHIEANNGIAIHIRELK